MIESKPWIWNKVSNPYWETPDEQVILVIKRWKEQKVNTVLDLGCGTGRHSIFLANQGFDVSAFDLAQDGVDTFKEKVRDLELPIDIQVGDMLDLPYEEESFDAVLSMYTVHHADLNGLEKTLKNVHKVLKPGGEAFITLTSKETDSWEKYKENRIDDFTLIKTEGPEMNVPHTYVDYEKALELIKDFSLIKIQQITNYFPKLKKKHSHFFILMKK
ncbi:MAG: class I SAM-dependent methyltransferase [Patescibacteria group bacterium]